MKKRRLGKSRLAVSAIRLGFMGMTLGCGPEADTQDIVNY